MDYMLKNVIAWQKARHLSHHIYKLVETYPKIEMFNLSDQMRRASTSVVLNISEGYSRNSVKDKRRFLNIAYGSAIELQTQLQLSLDRKYLNIENFLDILKLVIEVEKLICGLYKKPAGKCVKLP